MKKRNLEISVGIFGIISVLLIAGLLFHFGKLGTKFRGSYPIAIELPDASGVRNGVPVRIGGMLAGYVSSNPELKSDYTGMRLGLAVFDSVKIPEGSRFYVATTGLMGDKYVSIQLPKQLSGNFISENEVIKASSAGMLQNLDPSAQELVSALNETLTELNRGMEKIDQVFDRLGSLTKEGNVEMLGSVLKNLNESSGNINAASKELGPLLTDINQTSSSIRELTLKLSPMVASAETTLTDIKTTSRVVRDRVETIDIDLTTGLNSFRRIADSVVKAEPGLAKIDGTLTQLSSTLENVDGLIGEYETSNGLLKEIVHNPYFRDDFVDFVDKVESNGFIFYPRDKKGCIVATPVSQTKPPRRPLLKKHQR